MAEEKEERIDRIVAELKQPSSPKSEPRKMIESKPISLSTIESGEVHPPAMESTPNQKVETLSSGWQWGPMAIIEVLGAWLWESHSVEENQSSHDQIESTTEPSQKDQSNSQFWGDWEFVMKSIDILMQQHQNHWKAEMEEELKSLKERAQTLKLRPKFLESAQEAIKKVPSEDEPFLNTVLVPSLRTGVLRSSIKKKQNEWKSGIRKIFTERNKDVDQKFQKFESAFEEEKYSKNIEGALQGVANLGSGNQGLSGRLLGEITWLLWSCLFKEIKETLNLELTNDENESLVNLVLEIQEPLVSLWIHTAKISRHSAEKEGRLPLKWMEEEKVEKNRLWKIKKVGADASWLQKSQPLDELRKLSSTRNSIANLKQHLETSLQLGVARC